MKNEELVYLILAVVEEIPAGNVASYGQIAKLAGYPKNARQVGKILSRAGFYGDYPCHRVLRGDGKLVEGWEEQKGLLIAEGIKFTKENSVDMKIYQWKSE